MKVAYDGLIFCRQIYGGISRYFTKIIPNISKKADIKIFSPLYRNKYLSEIDQKLIYGLPLKKYPRKSALIVEQVSRLLSIRPIKKFNPDLTHLTYYLNKLDSYKKNKLIITVYDMNHELFPELFSKYDNTKQAKENSITRANHIICISENTKLDLQRIYNVAESKISVIHLGVQDGINVSFKRCIKDKYILYVGSRWGYKNFLNLLLAYLGSPDINSEYSLVLFGGGPLSKRELFEINSYPHVDINKIIVLEGDEDILGSLYTNAELFIYPSIYEGFGLPLLEAMRYSCPVAASNCAVFLEIGNLAVEFFDPYSPSSISNSIRKVLFSEKYSLDLINLGKINIKNYSWEKTSNLTYETYNRLI